MLFLKQQLISPFHRHKLATTYLIDSNKVSKPNLKPDQCNCIKIEIIESAAPPQWPHKQGTNIFGTPCMFKDLQRFDPML